ncbi:hypothetical protein ABN034_30095 [Actinopolymorpha sp. B11F2]|uniref:hypothetical protein n=1 Tax=Actinopolymorpha sp. B11F2 TaxID=3160862 RepID=UPI0032E44653
MVSAVPGNLPTNSSATASAADAFGSRAKQANTGSTLSAPVTAGNWTRVDDAAARARRQEAVTTAKKTGGGSSPVFAEYQRGGAGSAFLGFNTDPDGQFRAELRESPPSAVRDYMAGAKVTSLQFVESGSADVAMACGLPDQAQARRAIVCAWADSSTLGIITWSVPNLTMNRADDLTRDFRRTVSRPAR